MNVRRSWLSIGLLAFWIVPASVAVIGFQIVPSARNPDITLLELSASQFLVWFAWAVWSVVIIAASKRFPFARGRVLHAVAVHVLLAIVVISLPLYAKMTDRDADQVIEAVRKVVAHFSGQVGNSSG